MLTHTFALVFMVGLPVFVTWMAPITRLKLVRDPAGVTLTSTSHVCLVIPFTTRQLPQVTRVDNRFVKGETRTVRDKEIDNGRPRQVKSEDQSFLVFSSATDKLEVPISTVDVTEKQQQVQDFLGNANADSLHLYTVANWKVSLLAGIPLTLLTILYAAISYSVSRLPSGRSSNSIRILPWGLGVPPDGFRPAAQHATIFVHDVPSTNVKKH